ncbi:hypothetical protein TW78_22335, partial [Vibrio coralliilyticus]
MQMAEFALIKRDLFPLRDTNAPKQQNPVLRLGFSISSRRWEHLVRICTVGASWSQTNNNVADTKKP